MFNTERSGALMEQEEINLMSGEMSLSLPLDSVNVKLRPDVKIYPPMSMVINFKSSFFWSVALDYEAGEDNVSFFGIIDRPYQGQIVRVEDILLDEQVSTFSKDSRRAILFEIKNIQSDTITIGPADLNNKTPDLD